MPRYAKFLFVFLLFGLFCTWASFFALLYVKGIPDFAFVRTPVAQPLTPVVATESPLPIPPTTPSTTPLPDSPDLPDSSASSTPTSSLADATEVAVAPSATPAVPVDVPLVTGGVWGDLCPL